MAVEYRGYKIETDEDCDGEKIVYVITPHGDDPIEIIGANVNRAKAIIDEMIADLAEADCSDD